MASYLSFSGAAISLQFWHGFVELALCPEICRAGPESRHCNEVLPIHPTDCNGFLCAIKFSNMDPLGSGKQMQGIGPGTSGSSGTQERG